MLLRPIKKCGFEGRDNLLNEIVVSASRTPERIIESPVTIERMGVAEIKKDSFSYFYDGLENLKRSSNEH
jgi:hypothetical protein